MDAQLVGTARQGREGDACGALAALQHAVAGHGRFPVTGMHHLAWTVVGIEAEGKVNGTFGTGGGKCPLQDGLVALLYRAVGELLL